MQKATLFFLLAIFFFSFGCFDTIVSVGCRFAPEKDRDHCFQFGAVQTSNAELCEKIEGRGFTGSNPPKDKCFYLIANKTNDPSYCSKMKGGLWSYDPEECYSAIAKNTKNPEVCREVKGDAQRECLKAFNLPPTYFAQQSKNQSKDLEKMKNGSSDTGGSGNTSSPQSLGLPVINERNVSSRTSKILSSMSPSAKSTIRQASRENDKTLAQQPLVPSPPQKKEDGPGYVRTAWEWVGWGAQRTKDALGDQTPSSIQKVSTAKEAYDYVNDVADVRDSVERVNEKVSQNKIDEKRGKLLTVGYGLGKAVKWVASKVPIVGDTVGTVADESMKTGMKFGEKLAERATKTDKCIEDPMSDDCID